MELFDKSGKQIDKSEVLHVLLKEVLETQLTGVQYDYLDVELLKDSKTLLTPLFVDFVSSFRNIPFTYTPIFVYFVSGFRNNPLKCTLLSTSDISGFLPKNSSLTNI